MSRNVLLLAAAGAAGVAAIAATILLNKSKKTRPEYIGLEISSEQVENLKQQLLPLLQAPTAEKLKQFVKDDGYHVTLWHHLAHNNGVVPDQLKRMEGLVFLVEPVLFAEDDTCMALEIRFLTNADGSSAMSFNACPHITLWFVEASQAKHSNVLLQGVRDAAKVGQVPDTVKSAMPLQGMLPVLRGNVKFNR